MKVKEILFENNIFEFGNAAKINYMLFAYEYEHLSNCSGVPSVSKNAKIYICYFQNNTQHTFKHTHTRKLLCWIHLIMQQKINHK